MKATSLGRAMKEGKDTIVRASRRGQRDQQIQSGRRWKKGQHELLKKNIIDQEIFDLIFSMQI